MSGFVVTVMLVVGYGLLAMAGGARPSRSGAIHWLVPSAVILMAIAAGSLANVPWAVALFIGLDILMHGVPSPRSPGR